MNKKIFGGAIFLVVLVVAGFLAYKWFQDEEPWISYTSSGGIAGTYLEMSLLEDGSAKAVEQEGAEPNEFIVPPEEMAQIEKLVSEVDWDEAAGDHTVAGADLIYYTIEVDHHVASGTQLTEEEATLRPLLAALSGIAATEGEND